MECYEDLMRRIGAAEDRLTNKWKNGQSTTPIEQGAAAAFAQLRKLVEFNKRRLRNAVEQAESRSQGDATPLKTRMKRSNG